VSVRPLTITLLPSCCCPSRSSLCSCFQRGHCKPKYGSVRGSRFHSRDSVIPSAIPVSLYGLEAVLLARSHQRGFWRATGYRAQVPGTPAPPTSTCMFMPGSSSGMESRRALLARLVPCLRSHIAFWTVRLRRREPSTFRGNDWRACLRLRRDQIARTLIAAD
jgi:hypothetical protein